MQPNIFSFYHCAPTVKCKVPDSDKTVAFNIPSICSSIMAELTFMSVNKTNSNDKQTRQFNRQYENVQVQLISIQIKIHGLFLPDRC